jgi:hypothetical protein
MRCVRLVYYRCVVSICIFNMQAYTEHVSCSALTSWHCTIARKSMQEIRRSNSSCGGTHQPVQYTISVVACMQVALTTPLYVCWFLFWVGTMANKRHRCGIMSVLLYDVWAQRRIAGEHGPGNTACTGLRVRSSCRYGLRLDSVRSLCYARKCLHLAVGLTVQSAAASGMHQRDDRLCNST